MSKVSQANDKYFRSTFGEVGFAKDFLSNYLPKELVDIIDMDTLESQPTSHITSDLKDQFSDLLFKVDIMNREGYVYFLFEHKSYQDRMVIFQILKYMIAIWEAKIKEDLEEKKEANISYTGDLDIPLVIPLVVYHGKYEWNVRKTLGEMIPNYMYLPGSIKKYVPDFEYMLSDLGFSDNAKDLDKDNSLIIRALEKARYASKDEILDIFKEVVITYTQRKDRDMVDHHVVETTIYILSTRDDISREELYSIAGQISEEGGELVMSGAEKLQVEAREEGIGIGIEQGKQEGLRESIRRILLRRFKSSDIDINKGLDEISDMVFLEDMLDVAIQVGSLEEFKTILNNI